MPIGEPHISAECDICGQVTDPMDMTALAGGGWDARNIPAKLKRTGWLIEGDKLTCPDCQPEEQ